jgi:uncharacterized protein DUF4177
MPRRYEYKFIRIGENRLSGFFGVEDKARKGYDAVVHEHARDGWRLVQIFAPGVAAFGAAKYYELIFEREQPAPVEGLERTRTPDGEVAPARLRDPLSVRARGVVEVPGRRTDREQCKCDEEKDAHQERNHEGQHQNVHVGLPSAPTATRSRSAERREIVSANSIPASIERRSGQTRATRASLSS